MTAPASRVAAALATAKAAHDVLALGEIDLAERLARLALETDNSAGNCHSVMAGVFEAQARFDDALPHWRRAVACAPDSAGHRFNLALALMRLGKLEEGLALQESRYDKTKWQSLAAEGSLDGLLHRIPRPGDSLRGKRVLVFTEQGLGDCIWAARWLPALAALGPRLTLAARPALRPLLEKLVPFEEVLGPPPETPDAKINLAALAGRFDAFVPIMSLPWLLGVREPSAAGTPWLKPQAKQVAAWRERYTAQLPGRNRIVGLVWLANPDSQSGAVRSVPAETLRPLGSLEDVGLVLLQGGAIERRAELLAVLPRAMDGLAEGDIPLNDFAAAIAATDLLITVDTMAMHVAGSMTHPTLVLKSPQVPGFILTSSKHCSWYSSLHLTHGHLERTLLRLVQKYMKKRESIQTD